MFCLSGFYSSIFVNLHNYAIRHFSKWRRLLLSRAIPIGTSGPASHSLGSRGSVLRLSEHSFFFGAQDTTLYSIYLIFACCVPNRVVVSPLPAPFFIHVIRSREHLNTYKVMTLYINCRISAQPIRLISVKLTARICYKYDNMEKIHKM